MYEIINGKKYDTDTATEIGYRFSGDSRRDHRAVEETLYRKRSGEFFIAGWGGPRTEYGVNLDGGMRSDGERIRPLSDYDAYHWINKHLDADKCDRLFIKFFGGKIPEKTKLEIIKYECNNEWDISFIELSDGSCWFEDEHYRGLAQLDRKIRRRLDHRINISSVTWDWDGERWVFTNGKSIPWSDYDDEFPELDED